MLIIFSLLLEYGFNSLSNLENENINFSHLTNFKELDIGGSVVDPKLLNNLFKTSHSLRFLNLSYCFQISDQIFTNVSINCPLEELNLSFLTQVN
jgi:hypothetical protein